MGDITSSAEAGVMLRQMADRHTARFADELTALTEFSINDILNRFKPSGDDAADIQRLSDELANIFDLMDVGDVEERIGEALFQAGDRKSVV